MRKSRAAVRAAVGLRFWAAVTAARKVRGFCWTALGTPLGSEQLPHTYRGGRGRGGGGLPAATGGDGVPVLHEDGHLQVSTTYLTLAGRRYPPPRVGPHRGLPPAELAAASSASRRQKSLNRGLRVRAHAAQGAQGPLGASVGPN